MNRDGLPSKMNWAAMYNAALNWDIQPSEFWAMSLCEWMSIYDTRERNSPGRYAGNLTAAQLDDIEELLAKHGAAPSKN